LWRKRCDSHLVTVKRAGEISGLTIGGEVKLGEPVEFEPEKVKSKREEYRN